MFSTAVLFKPALRRTSPLLLRPGFTAVTHAAQRASPCHRSYHRQPTAMAPPPSPPPTSQRDPTTLSNYGLWRTRHTAVDFTVDFDRRRLRGSVTLTLESQTDSRAGAEIVLDTRFVDVSAARVDGADTHWRLGQHAEPLGAPLRIVVPVAVPCAHTVDVALDVETTDRCTALQWLAPGQTAGGAHPYMFSQCQAINCRSIFPCQDTPDVKSTVRFTLRSILPVIASGVAVTGAANVPDAGGEFSTGEEKAYEFVQEVPIPSYLFAVASGDLRSAKIGARSRVAAEPDELAACRWELERDVDRFVAAAEVLTGVPYRWGEFNVLVLPPSFPYGGMENPVWTFATPTIVSGDRQNVDVVAHELAHSWSGNLATAASWEHFWLNEGWTMYLERRIVAAVHGGGSGSSDKAVFDFSAIIGWKGLEDAVALFGPEHEYTKLVIGHGGGVDPEDVYSQVAYEKGFHLLYYLDRLVGRAAFDAFIPHYFSKWAGKSLDSFEFRDTFMEFFGKGGEKEDEELRSRVAAIDWDDKLFSPGLPPKPEFDTTLVKQCYDLAAKWKDSSYEPQGEDVKGLTANQLQVFLGEVAQQQQKQGDSLSAEQARRMGSVYGFCLSKNVEILAAYYGIALKAGDATCRPGVVELLGRVGRMKFVRPLYRALSEVDRGLAVETFERNREFYHPICRGMVEKDLKV